MDSRNSDHGVELSIAETAHRSAQIRNASRMLDEAYDARNKAALVAASDTCFRCAIYHPVALRLSGTFKGHMFVVELYVRRRLARSNIVLSERHANLTKRMSEEACRTQRMQEVLNGYVSDDLRELAGKNEEAAEVLRMKCSVGLRHVVSISEFLAGTSELLIIETPLATADVSRRRTFLGYWRSQAPLHLDS